MFENERSMAARNFTKAPQLTGHSYKEQDPMSHRIIEKRRRDRMNNCLADLSRLIPADYLKKGRGRIEKTEIIEMAIKHMKYLQQHHRRDEDNVSVSEHYRLGFHECLQETIRYLCEREGFFPREAICVKLINHLQKHCESVTSNESFPSSTARHHHLHHQQQQQPNSQHLHFFKDTSGSSNGLSNGNNANVNNGGGGGALGSNYTPTPTTPCPITNSNQSNSSAYGGHSCNNSSSSSGRNGNGMPSNVSSNHHQPDSYGTASSVDSYHHASMTPDSAIIKDNNSNHLLDTTKGAAKHISSNGDYVKIKEDMNGYRHQHTQETQESGDYVYKYKNNIKQRFTQDLHAVENGRSHKRQRSTDLRNSSSLSSAMETSSSENRSSSPSGSEVCTRVSSESEHTNRNSPVGSSVSAKSVIDKTGNVKETLTNLKTNFSVPIFVLHAKGSFYVPLTIDYNALVPFLHNYNILEIHPVQNVVLHPVTINVNFQPNCVQNNSRPAKYKTELQNGYH